MHIFCEYDWPGNVREMRNLVIEAMIVALHNGRGEITLNDLPIELKSKPQSSSSSTILEFATTGRGIVAHQPSDQQLQNVLRTAAYFEEFESPKTKNVTRVRKMIIETFFGIPATLTRLREFAQGVEYVQSRLNLPHTRHDDYTSFQINKALAGKEGFSTETMNALTAFLRDTLRQDPQVIEAFHQALKIYNAFFQKRSEALNPSFPATNLEGPPRPGVLDIEVRRSQKAHGLAPNS